MRMQLTSRPGAIRTKERTGRKPQSRQKVTFTPVPDFMLAGEHVPCADRPDLFIHQSGGRAGADLNHLAKGICRLCPFRLPCDAWATTNRQTGVWGGKDANDRAAARRRARGGYACAL